MSIFAWGLGKNGQLGQGCGENSLIPTKILIACDAITLGKKKNKNQQNKEETPGDSERHSSKVSCITAGGLMTGFLLTNGDVYFCGSGTHGRLGTGNETDCLNPVKIDIPSTDRILKVKTLHIYSLAANEC